MPYDFKDSKNKLKKETEIAVEQKALEEEQIKSEKLVALTFWRPFCSSILIIFLFYLFVFKVLNMENLYANFGLWLYLSYPSISIIAEILFTKKVRYRYYEGTLYVGNTKYERGEIKKAAITEYSPYYCKNSFFRIPAVNFAGYREYYVNLTPVKGKPEAFFFLCSKDSAQNFMGFLYKHKIPYGIVEKEFRKLFFYY